MNINEITIGEAKQIAAMFQGMALTPSMPISQHPMVGKFCIARCVSAGVHAGEVVSVDGENVILKDSTRLWSWKAKDGLALSGVAQHGIKTSESMRDAVNPIIYITGVCELIPCTEAAKESIRA